MSERLPLDLSGPLPTKRTVVEASAGTGKTYSLTALITRYVAEAGVDVDEILVVTFTRAAANELRERTRETLILAAEAIEVGQVPAGHDWMAKLLEQDTLFDLQQRRQRLLDAVNRFDDLSITTIHGFCQQALGQLGLRSGSDREAVLMENTRDLVAEVCRDLLVTELADDPTKLSMTGPTVKKPRTPGQVQNTLIDTVLGVLTNPGARCVPDDLTGAATSDELVLARRWADLVERAKAETQRRQRLRGQIGYDSLVAGLRDALADPVRGEAVAAQLAARFEVVLVDEFQDTDRLQWEVFESAFRDRALITVGDPKQAIYRFRGADVHAYLAAVAGSTVFNLAVNRRSDRQVLAGVETLFEGATLGDPRIGFVPVTAGPRALDCALRRLDPDEVAAPAVHLRTVPLDDRLRRNRSQLAMPLVRPLILADVAGRIIDVLDHDVIVDGDGGTRPVVPGDIAVLVPSHSEAHHVAEALQRAGIPAVRTRTGSVLDSPAVLQWRLLLAALARPYDAPIVRAAALGWFLRTPVAELVGETSNEVLEALQERAATMGEQMRSDGLASFYDHQKSSSKLLEVVLAQPDGDRNITDLDHIGELLAEALHGSPSDAPGVLRVLEDLIANDVDRNEETMRRIESDALAVQVTTIHAAKGLEYPIVLVPFSFKPGPNLAAPWTYTDRRGRRTLDVASNITWDLGPEIDGDETSRQCQARRRFDAKVENDGDSLRMLYVALTRAQHRLELWWASIQRSRSSALGRLLLDRDSNGLVRNTAATLSITRTGRIVETELPWIGGDEDAPYASILDLARRSEGTLGLTELPATIEHPLWKGSDGEWASDLAVATCPPRPPLADDSWRNWSFTRLSARADHLGAADGSDGTDGPSSGGTDEPSADVDGLVPVEADQVALLADVVAGTTFGTFVHTVLEELDFTAADLHGVIRAAVVAHGARAGVEAAVDVVTSGLVAALRTPLGPLFGGRSLSQIAPRDRLAEMTFDVPLAAATDPEGARLPAASIGALLLDTLPERDPVRPFAVQLQRDFGSIDLAGWMNGSIDALFRIPDGDDHRYVVVDYKTNRLHVPGASHALDAYRPDNLVPAMAHHRYPLQALIYAVAVHRYLRWRLGRTYSPDRHLGGVAYLFIRGMIGPETPVVDGVPHGVFSWRPPAATIIALDELFAGAHA